MNDLSEAERAVFVSNQQFMAQLAMRQPSAAEQQEADDLARRMASIQADYDARAAELQRAQAALDREYQQRYAMLQQRYDAIVSRGVRLF